MSVLRPVLIFKQYLNANELGIRIHQFRREAFFSFVRANVDSVQNSVDLPDLTSELTGWKVALSVMEYPYTDTSNRRRNTRELAFICSEKRF